MAGFQNFTPRTANLAPIFQNLNPAASFLGGMKAVRQMDLDQAAEERLRESAEIDRMVKTSMLPLEMEKARADIALSIAGAGERAARAKYLGLGGAKALSERQMRFEAASDPDALNKGASYLPSFDVDVSVPASPSESKQIDYDNSTPALQFNLTDDGGDFLTSAAESFPNPATDLSGPSYTLSNSPEETSASVNSGAAQLPQAGPQELSQIKALAKSGDKMAEQFTNPLSEFKTPQEEKNPLDDFDASPESAIENTLKENENAFAGPRPQQRKDTLGNKISQFQSWDRAAKKSLHQLQKANPGAHQQALMAYDQKTQDFYANNFQGLDQDEINFLTKNPSKADRYMAYKSDFSPEESAFLTKINPSYADGIVKVFKEGKLPDGTPAIADSLDEAKAIYADAIRRGMKPATPADPVKTVQEEVNLVKSWTEAQQNAADKPDDKDAQIVAKLLKERVIGALGAERFAKAEFDLGQETYNRLFSLQGQKKQPDGTPADGLESKTADQVRIENLNSDSPMIPVVQTKLNKDGVEGIDDRGLENVPEGSMFAVKSNNGFKTYKKVSKGTYSLLDTVSPATPVKEKPAPAEGNPFRAKAEASRIAQGTQSMDDEIYKIQVEMDSLDKQRESLSTPVKEPFLGREFRSRETMPERDPEWSANQYDAITAKMKELAGKRKELLAKRRAIKNQK
jgi:hypothetical protein